MALPETRDYDPIDTGPLPASTVAALQDGIVGRLHGEIPLVLDPFSCRAEGGAPTMSGSFWVAAGAPDSVVCGIRLPAGTVITNIALHGYQQGATPMGWELRTEAVDGTDTQLVENLGSAATGNRTIQSAVTQPILVSRMYYLRWNAGQASDRLHFFEIKIKKTS